MKNYRIGVFNHRPAIFSDRGVVCVFEAGHQGTREKDAQEVLAALIASEEAKKNAIKL